MNQDNSCAWCYGQPLNRESGSDNDDSDVDIKINTFVNIWQNGEANGGNANGGDGGFAIGGDAAAASAEFEFDEENGAAAIAPASIPNAVARRRATNSNTEGDLEALQSLIDDINADVAVGEAAAIAGTAVGGDGGNGGTGGAGGSATNTATVTVENVIVITCGEIETALTLGASRRNLKITMDESGNTFVNGEKMDEKQLPDGTKVFIFKNSEAIKAEAAENTEN